MAVFAFFMSTMIKTTKMAYTASYAVILAGLVLQFLLSNIMIIYFLYSTSAPDWVVHVRNAFLIYPPFNFSKGFGDISRKASSHYNYDKQRWDDGDGYSVSDLTQTINGKDGSTTYEVPCTLETIGFLCMDIAILGILTWIFDHIISGNRGSAE